MENLLINHHHISSSPLVTNDYHDNDNNNDDYIEMFAYGSGSYTSLKDMMTSSPPLSTSSPNGGSWREIPIKDPLLQHAAWAYLQPIEVARDEHERWWKKWCFGCLNDIVSVVLSWFSEQGSDRGDDERVD